MPNLNVRMSDDDMETLDKLVIAWRAYYGNQPAPFNRLAAETTRSSALRDLLLAWKTDKSVIDRLDPNLTEQPS